MTATVHHGWARFLPLLLVVGLVVAWLPAATAWGEARDISEDVCDPPYQSDFDDIEGSAHEDNIRCMADYRLTEGVGDGSSYAPRRDVTRGQMASFVARFLEDYLVEPLPDGNPQRFDDVPENDDDYPHATNIHSLAEIGVVEGTASSGGDSYAPQARVTRAQMAAMIRRALSWLDDGDARNGTAPEDADENAFADTEGSTHEPDIDAIAAVGIVQGFDDDTYRPNALVKRDQMASFVMRSYDFAVAEELGHEDDGNGDDTDPAPGPVRITSPTTDAPQFPVSPGDSFEVVFTTDTAGDYELLYRDPNPEGDSFFIFPVPGDDEPGAWEALEGDAEGSVDQGDTHAVSVTLPESEEDEGVRDLQLRFHPDETTTITNTQESALVVGDGVVINLDQDRVDFEIQAAVDAAEDGDTLLAIGAFEETVTIDEVDDLRLSGIGADDTVLDGSIIVDGVEGLHVTDLTVTAYATHSALGLGLIGDEIGIVLADATDVILNNLVLTGAGQDSDDVAVEVADAVSGRITSSTISANDIGVHLSGNSGDFVIGAGNLVTDNALGVHVDEDAREATVTGSGFSDNTEGVRVEASFATIEGNSFDEHGDLGLRLVEGADGADVTDNTFGADNEEHVRFHTATYPSTYAASLVNSNTFAPGHITSTDGDDTVIAPEVEEEEDTENNA